MAAKIVNPADLAIVVGTKAKHDQALALTREILEGHHSRADIDKAVKDLALDIRNILMR